MIQSAKAEHFTALHVPGDPLVVYNVWDAGSAKAISDAGAVAIATGSWSVAAAQGYPDGEKIPLELVLDIAGRIAAATDLPVSIDFEGGYAREPKHLRANIQRLLETGAIGINFEDQIIGDKGLYPIEEQADRIASIRQSAQEADVPLFINARTDLFLKQSDRAKHASLVDQAIERADRYAAAGASGFFVPGLTDAGLISRVCGAVSLPVNVMRPGATPSRGELGQLGVARISAGPAPYREMISHLTARFAELG